MDDVASDEPGCQVRTLTAERTFWEKATLLHALAHRALDKPLDSRMSRHYYDVAKLYESAFGPKALADRLLLEKVVEHKSLFFRSAGASYETAVPGTFRVVPPKERLASLKEDYRTMRTHMIFEYRPYEFEELMAVITEVEAKINEAG
jgi:hypothetical protein